MNHPDAFVEHFQDFGSLLTEVGRFLSSPTSLVALQPYVGKRFNGVQSLEVDADLRPAGGERGYGDEAAGPLEHTTLPLQLGQCSGPPCSG